ncbi:MAG: oxygen-dependent coproporphyrinogen oxidase [Candidatus Eremiobacteraeota bacterium]|nr:oxygen-dependent coproporphyrinogen oxidase [Candidatus Eremiobacteraeota bacterium]
MLDRVAVKAQKERLGSRAQSLFEAQQKSICAELASLDGRAEFRFDKWERSGGGGGLTAILNDGALFERAGVNTSTVWGEFDATALAKLGGQERRFFATGISMVLHPHSPMVPTMHANFRYLTRGEQGWFGGGSDLTPYITKREDVQAFHRAWKSICDRHDSTYYACFKAWCDRYFTIPHRGEMRGVGGIFFDDLADDLEKVFAFVSDCCQNVLSPYLPIVQRRRDEPYGERERRFQLWRRGRYVEFNLIYDRGTSFGLATHGRTESILMSLPPLASWTYAYEPEPGSPEAQALTYYQPKDWLA